MKRLHITRCYQKTLFLLFVSCLFKTVFAGELGQNPHENWSRVLTISAGPVWGTPGKTQNVLLIPSLQQLYVADKNTETIANGEIALSLQKRLNQSWLGQIGLAIAGTTSFPLSGQIWQDNDPEFYNFNYEYKINHTYFALRGRLFNDFYSFLQPFIGASVGVGINHTYHYSNTPLIVEVSPEAPFQPQNTTTFSYTLDAGLQKQLNEHWSVAMGYEFGDWGKSQLGRANGQTSNAGLSLNHIYVNQLLISVSFTA